MKIRFCIFVLLFSSLLPLYCTEIEQLQDKMIQELETVKLHLNAKYAPKILKKELFGWDVENSYNQAKTDILSNSKIDQKAYRKIIKQFLQSTHDYHVNQLFFSTEWAFLPLSIKGINGRYFFSNIFSVSLGEEILFASDIDKIDNFPSKLSAGDELIAINGRHPKDIIEEIIDDDLGGNRTPTGYALAEKKVFVRMGKYGDTIPKKPITLHILHKNNKLDKYTLDWFKSKEWIKDPVLNPAADPLLDSIFDVDSSDPMNYFVTKNFSVSIARDYEELSKAWKHPHFFTSKKNKNAQYEDNEEDEEKDTDKREKGFLPPLGKVIWENNQSENIYAYLFESSSGHKVGYLRLHSFHFVDEEAKEIMNEIIEILNKFNEHSSALVIDITNNSGGMEFFMFAVLSTLVEDQAHPLELPKESELVMPADAYYAALTLAFMSHKEKEDQTKENIHGYYPDPDREQKLELYFKQILQDYEAGVHLTVPQHRLGMDKISCHPKIQYKKPLIVLINELDFSCADYFPAVLQDNKRAILFGTRTAGAGGYVNNYSFPSRFGVNQFTLTGSIGFRQDGKPIENLGITPDVPYTITERDLKENYVDYIKALNETIHQLLK